MNNIRNREQREARKRVFTIHHSGIILIYLMLFSFFTSCSDNPAVELSAEAKLVSFTFLPQHNVQLEEVATGTISDFDIAISVPYQVSFDKLIATFEYKGTSIQVGGDKQVSGVTANSFINPVVYTVIAEDGTKSDYTVRVTNNLPRIPSVYITTAGEAPILDKENYVTSTLIIDDLDSYFSSETVSTNWARIRGRGNSTWGMPKKPYRIKLDSKASLLGMKEHKDWVLLADYFDKTFLRNITAFETSRIADMSWTPTSVSVEFYLNGKYQGVYALTEKVEVAKERLDMELVKSSDNSGEALTGGYLLELDFHYDDEYKFKTYKEKLPIMFKDPKRPTGEQFTFVQNYYNQAEQVLYSNNFKDQNEGYRKYIDVESFINYYIVQELAKNVDGNMRGSCYMAIRQNSKIEMPLVWDFDLAFGNADYITWEQGATSAEYDGWYIKTRSPWFDRFFQDPSFVAQLKKRWNELKPELDQLPNFIKQRALMLQDAQSRNFATKANGGAGWDINKVEWNTNRIRGSYNAEVNYLVSFVEKRIGWLDTNINNLR